MGFNTKKHQITDKDIADIKTDLDGYYASDKATSKKFDEIDTEIAALQSVQDKFYGVKFKGSNPVGERIGAAVGLSTAVGVDDEVVDNDFDHIFPWSEYRECNGYYDDEGEFVVTAYADEPGFARDGSNGDVYVEYPQFFVRETSTEEIPAETDDDQPIEATETFMISPTEIYGFRLPEKFIKLDGTRRTKIYIPTYEAGKDGNVPVSQSGFDVSSPAWNYNTMLSACKLKGNGYSGMTMEDHEILKFLVLIEFATKNTQEVLRGAVDLVNSGAQIRAEATDADYILVDNTCEQFYEGCPIKIHTSSGNKDGEYHNVTVIAPYYIPAFETPDAAESGSEEESEPAETVVPEYDETTTYYTRSGESEPYTYEEYTYNPETWATDYTDLYLPTTFQKLILEAGASVTVTTSMYVYCCPFKTGYTDNVVASVGAYKANNGKFPIKYRGIENPWGNTYTVMHGIVIKARQSYVTKDAANSPTTVNDTVTALSYKNSTVTGYVSKLGHDERYPAHTLPIVTEGAEDTDYCDRYTRNASASNVCAVRFGGGDANGSTCGLFCFYCNNALAFSNVSYSSRLSYTG